MQKRIRILAKEKGIQSEEQISVIKKAILERKDEIVLDADIFTKKKWQEFKNDLNDFRIQTSPIYFRYPQKKYKKIVQNGKPVKCAVMGPCGSGKTSLINVICGTDLPTGQTARSLTKNVTELESQIKYENPLVIYDTPGTTAKIDKFEHAAHLKQLLQFKPLNCILVIMIFENRGDDLLKSIYNHVKMLPGYEKNILFLVTHIDQAQNPKSCIQDIDQMMKEVMPTLNNQIIFLSNLNVDSTKLSNAIYEIASSFPLREFKIDEKTFFKHYNLAKQDTQELFFKADEQKFSKEMEKIAQTYINYAISLESFPQRDALLQDLQISLKSELLEILDEFTAKYKYTMTRFEYYQSFYTLQLRIKDYLHEYLIKVGSKLNSSYLEHSATGEKTDIRDLIKKCPNPSCGLIWFRIESCPNTTCGSRPSCFFDFLKKPFYRFRIYRDHITNKIKVFLLEKSENKNKSNLSSKDMKSKQSNSKHLGCGQAMNFDILPRLPNIQQILKEWYGVHTIEEVIKRFQSDKYIQNTRLEFEAKINDSLIRNTKY